MTTDNAMLEMLEKVQPLQAEVLRKHYDAHVDAGTYGKYRDEPYISFDFTIFDETDIIFDIEFSARDTQEMLDANLAKLKAFINSL